MDGVTIGHDVNNYLNKTGMRPPDLQSHDLHGHYYCLWANEDISFITPLILDRRWFICAPGTRWLSFPVFDAAMEELTCLLQTKCQFRQS
jgi:hypothetical protein